MIRIKHRNITAPQEVRHNNYYFRDKNKIVLSALQLMRERSFFTAKQVARAAGLTRQTIRNIFGKAERIIPTWERETEDEFRLLLAEKYFEGLGRAAKRVPGVSAADINNRMTFSYLFLFLARRQEVFAAAAETSVGHEILRRLAEVVYEELTITWVPRGASPVNDGGEAVDIFLETMTVLIWRWCYYDECKIGRAKVYIQKLVWLADDASRRCKL